MVWEPERLRQVVQLEALAQRRERAAIALFLRKYSGVSWDKRQAVDSGRQLMPWGTVDYCDLFPIAPALNFLFGRGPLKQKETNLIGTASESGFSGITSTKFKAEGGFIGWR